MATGRAFLLIVALACGGRSDLGAPGQADMAADTGMPCVPGVVAAYSEDGAILIDASGDEDVFWVTRLGRIQRHDATGNALLAAVGSGVNGLAVNTTSVYFFSSGTEGLSTTPRGGGTPEVVPGMTGMVTGVAAAGSSGSMVVTTVLDEVTEVQRVDSDHTVHTLAQGGRCGGVVVADASSAYTELGVNGSPLCSLVRIDLTSGGVTSLGASGFVTALATASGTVFYATQEAGVMRVPSDGGTPTEVFTPPRGDSIVAMHADSDGLYVITVSLVTYTTPPSVTVLWRVSLDGGIQSQIANAPASDTGTYGFTSVTSTPTAIYAAAAPAPPLQASHAKPTVSKLCK